MHRWIKIFLLALVLLAVIAAAGFVVWGLTPSGPMPEALAALQSGPEVTVTEGKWLTFAPAGAAPTRGLILYPGGRVDYRSYAPAARDIAARGYLVVIPQMPLSLAVLNAEAAAEIIAAHPEIERWALGGHSLGGSMAASFAGRHPQAVDGLALWAAYPAGGDDLSGSGLRAASIYATLDGLVSDAEIDASRRVLPPDTDWTAIEGGNHAQFGWYGEQGGDNPATISRPEQQAQIVQATVALLEALE